MVLGIWCLVFNIMQSFILVGQTDQQKEYLDSFCVENGIQAYNKHEFPEFKMLDARSLIKLLSRKLHISEKRIAIISSPTEESQHAILKTIEELPENTYVFFLCINSDHLLPTILSRSKKISLESIPQEENISLKIDLEKLIDSEKWDQAFYLSEKYSEEKEQFDEIISSLRTLLLENVEKKEKAKLLYTALFRAIQLQILVKQNNINQRLALESIFTPSIHSGQGF